MLRVAERENFVSIDVPGWAWGALVAVLAVMLIIDLVRHRDAHAPSSKEAVIESIIWVSCGLIFAGVIAATFGADAFGEYISVGELLCSRRSGRPDPQQSGRCYPAIALPKSNVRQVCGVSRTSTDRAVLGLVSAYQRPSSGPR
jgi:hypothetical protein